MHNTVGGSVLWRLMVSAAFVYVTLYTFTNLMVALYLQKTVTICRTEKTVPRWAEKVRSFLDTLGDTARSYKNTDKDKDKDKDEKPEVQSAAEVQARKFMSNCAKLEFIQLNTDKDGKFDMKDEYERKAQKPKSSVQKSVDANKELPAQKGGFGDGFMNELMDIADGKDEKEEFNVMREEQNMRDQKEKDREIVSIFPTDTIEDLDAPSFT